MHNPTVYRATFNGLILTAFGKEQTLAFRQEIEMYQSSSSPERWSARPMMQTGRHKWEAASPAELAKILESDFVRRENDWIPYRSSGPRLPRPVPKNVVRMDQRRRSA
jgi:hypothetical protein